MEERNSELQVRYKEEIFKVDTGTELIMIKKGVGKFKPHEKQTVMSFNENISSEPVVEIGKIKGQGNLICSKDLVKIIGWNWKVDMNQEIDSLVNHSEIINKEELQQLL